MMLALVSTLRVETICCHLCEYKIITKLYLGVYQSPIESKYHNDNVDTVFEYSSTNCSVRFTVSGIGWDRYPHSGLQPESTYQSNDYSTS